jgi:ABC-type sugar transport system substrate-binding protein
MTTTGKIMRLTRCRAGARGPGCGEAMMCARRIVVLLLASLAGLCACGRDDGAARPAGQAPGAAAPAAATAIPSGNVLAGKTIAWVPLAMGVPTTEIWTRVMREEAQARGMKLEVRDPNWNTTAMLQAISSLIAEKPAVLVVHNPDVQLLAKALRQAEDAGIPVIQVNMESNYHTAAYVGADWRQIGRLLGAEAIRQCGAGSGRSGKVAIVQGEQTSGVSIGQMQGLSEAFAHDPSIQVVSNQAANWDASKAHDITATVLQQHPDLCASIGFWSTMEAGAAQAIKAAGKLGEVKVYSAGGEGKFDCEAVDSGLITRMLSWDTPEQARTIVELASFILQSGQPAGAFRSVHYSTLHWMEKGNYDASLCYDWTTPRHDVPEPR